MTMARAKARAVQATTDASSGPSRRCRCQSSGLAIFSVGIGLDKGDLILTRGRRRQDHIGPAGGMGMNPRTPNG